MAAAYLFHICQNHPFVDGNKRASGAASVVFLKVNGIEIDMAPDDFADMVFGVAGGTWSKARVADCLRGNCRLPEGCVSPE